MGWKLVKKVDAYYLKDESGETFACSSWAIYGRKLSVKNCDEIFGVIDVEKLADEYTFEQRNYEWKAYVSGFNKALEIIGDNKFDKGDIIQAINMAVRVNGFSEKLCIEDDEFSIAKNNRFYTENEIIQSLSQPTEIEVEVATENCGDKVYEVPEYVLDENGCLILTKK